MKDWANESDFTMVCYCKQVKKKDVVDAIKAGNTTVASLEKKLAVTTGCGVCRLDVEKLIEIYG